MTPTLALLLACAACGGSSGPTAEELAATVSLSAEEVVLRLLGDTRRLDADVRDRAGSPLPAARVTWTSADPGIASVNEGGVVTAEGPGSTRVTAASGAARASATVRVPPVPVVASVRVLAAAETSVEIAFDQVTDGFGGAADYEVRYAREALQDFADGTPVTAGSCATPVRGRAGGGELRCVVDGLEGGVTYAFRVAALRGAPGATAVTGTPSAPVTAVTACGARLRVDRAQVALVGVGRTAEVAAAGEDCAGRPVAATVTWTSSETGVVEVSAGHLSAVGVGEAWVRAGGACCAPDSVRVTVSPPPDAVWPNEPVAFREASRNPFTEPLASGACDAFGWCYVERDTPSEHRRIQDPSAPQGDGGVLEMYFAAGLPDGRDPGVHYTAVSDRELFVGYTFMIDPVFQIPETGQKLGPFFLEDPGDTDFFQLLKNVGGDRLRLGWNFVGGRVGGRTGQLLLPDRPGSMDIRTGVWYRVEAYVKRQGAAGDDGVVRWWLSQWNGEAWTEPLLQGSYTGLGFSGGAASRWIEFQLDSTWGGGNSDKRQADWIRIDRVYLSRP